VCVPNVSTSNFSLAEAVALVVVGLILTAPMATAVMLFVKQRLAYKKQTISEILNRNERTLAKYLERYPGQRAFQNADQIAENSIKTFFCKIDYWAALTLNLMAIVLGVLLIAGILNRDGLFKFVGWSGRPADLIQYIALALVAFVSAHFSNLYEVIRRSRNTDLSPSALHLMWIRLLFASYVGPVFATQLKVSFSMEVAISLAIGLLPLPSILEFAKQAISKMSSQAVTPSDKSTELGQLQGANATVVNTLLEADVTNIVQLAYSDPFTLFVKTSLSWTFLVDLIDQSLLYIYLRDKTSEVYANGVRGAIELATVGAQLASPNQDERTAGSDSVKALAETLGIPATKVLDLIRTLNADSQVNLIWHLFNGDPASRANTVPSLDLPPAPILAEGAALA
jgi:hypothetical protein